MGRNVNRHLLSVDKRGSRDSVDDGGSHYGGMGGGYMRSYNVENCKKKDAGEVRMHMKSR